MRVAVCGLGKLGAVMAAVLANAGNAVVGVDPNPRTVLAIKKGRPPVDEPGLPELIAQLPAGILDATDSYEDAVARTDIAMIVVPTPSLPAGAFSCYLVREAVLAIGAALRGAVRADPYVVVVCSTLSPGTMSAAVVPALEKSSGLTVGEGVLCAYSPEFIALGTVIQDMTSPDMVLIGANDAGSSQQVEALSKTFRPASPVRVMSLSEAELTKLAINGYLSVKIGYANMIGAAAHKAGADPHVVLAAVGADRRIGPAYLRNGGGPSGPCLPRDLVALETLGKELGAPMPLISAAREAARHVVDRVAEAAGFGGPHPKLDVAILGIAYKAGSHVTDESLGLQVMARASMAGVRSLFHDPIAKLPADFVWRNHRECHTAETAIAGAATVIIACPHPEYDSLDFGDRKVVNPWA